MSFETGLPEDFEAFWRSTVAEALEAPLDADRSANQPAETATHRIETFRFRGIVGQVRHGWIALPQEPELPRSPAFLWSAPYGRTSVFPNAYGTRPGYVSMSFNFHGHEAFHEEKYTPSRGYFAEGATEPETWIFRSMFQDQLLAVRVLRLLVEVDEDRIAAMGMSQGGGMSIWLGAWCPYVKVVIAEMPFLSGVSESLGRSALRYPLKELADAMAQMPLGEERIRHTLRYFDTSHHARFCQVPTLVSLGEKDPAVRPESALRAFDALPGRKKLIRYNWGHDWHPEMIDNNLTWLNENLR